MYKCIDKIVSVAHLLKISKKIITINIEIKKLFIY